MDFATGTQRHVLRVIIDGILNKNATWGGVSFLLVFFCFALGCFFFLFWDVANILGSRYNTQGFDFGKLVSLLWTMTLNASSTARVLFGTRKKILAAISRVTSKKIT